MDEFLVLAASVAVPLGLQKAWEAIEAALREQHPQLMKAPPKRSDADIQAEDDAVIAAKFGR